MTVTSTPTAPEFCCPRCGAEFFEHETDFYGLCAARPRRIEEGDWAYEKVGDGWVVEHRPTGRVTPSYISETEARNAVAAGRAHQHITEFCAYFGAAA
uniref:hypothetical protein n=1 Tax=Pseudonocardia sp. CA-138482 TaxID=3240023 RepID=UPI003F493997